MSDNNYLINNKNKTMFDLGHIRPIWETVSEHMNDIFYQKQIYNRFLLAFRTKYIDMMPENQYKKLSADISEKIIKFTNGYEIDDIEFICEDYFCGVYEETGSVYDYK